MSEQKPRFVNIEELQAAVDLETACRFYGVDPGELTRVGREVRAKCFLNCGKTEETGNRAVAINAENPVKQWKCHQYGCGKGGNLVTLCDLMKPGTSGNGAQPKGQRFIDIREDLRKMAGLLTEPSAAPSTAAKEPMQTAPVETPPVNVPLAVSENERARELVTLDERFLVVADETMDRYAAAYLRQHQFLTPEVCRRERCGYLARPGSTADRRGGTLQGMWVYGYLDEQSQPLTWFGRNPRFEELHRHWVSGGRQGNEPAKFHFVKGFHRGLEIYGQHEWNDPAVCERISQLGALLLVEGANDRIALKTMGVDAFAICSNIITREQAAKVATKSRQIGVPVAVMFDTDTEGENGARQSIPLLAQYGPVQYAWSAAMHDGKFKDRQPESLSHDDCNSILRRLRERTEVL